MPVKIFGHIGSDSTAVLEKQINDWLALLPAHGNEVYEHGNYPDQTRQVRLGIPR